MRLGGFRIPDMNDAGAQRDQHIGNDSPMTAPPEDLSAHDGGPETPGQHQELEQASGKLITVEVIRVTLEGRVAPGATRRLRRQLPAAAQGGNGYVVDPGGVKRDGERWLVVLGLATRTGKAPDIRDRFDPIRCEDGEKLGKRAGRMSHRPHGQGHASQGCVLMCRLCSAHQAALPVQPCAETQDSRSRSASSHKRQGSVVPRWCARPTGVSTQGRTCHGGV